MNKAKGMKGFIVVIVLLLLIVGYYAYLTNRSKPKEEETVLTEVQEVLLRDLEKNYPPTPKEVIKYYSMLTQCFYNEVLSEEDMKALGLKARQLYDEDLAATQEEGDYLQALKFDIEDFESRKLKVSSFSTSSSTDVEYYTQDGREWAKLYCIYNLRQETQMLSTQEVFLLRKDQDGHWKIFGWDLADTTDGQELENAEGNG